MISFIAITLALVLGVLVGAVGYPIAYFYKLGTCDQFYESQRMFIEIIGCNHTTEKTKEQTHAKC